MGQAHRMPVEDDLSYLFRKARKTSLIFVVVKSQLPISGLVRVINCPVWALAAQIRHVG